MKKEIITSITLLSINLCSLAEQLPDSLKQVSLDEVVVSSTRINNTTPIAFSDLNGKEIKQANTAKSIPYILQTLPSVVSYSEDGSGVGNTSMRIRGTDATRINVTLNGMPINNPESQEVYWVNLPDISNSLQNIQVQRGIGSSTNGSASFGASISLKTEGGKPKAYGQAATAIGSYNTFTSTISAGTGLLKNGLSLDARYSRVTGDGYIRNGKVNHKSAYAALSYYKDNQLFRLSYINGIQHTGITWEGISPEEMLIDRKYNPAGKYYDDAGNIHYYDNETDNYYSNIVQLNYSNIFSNYWTLNVGLNYNHGYGYYENYKMDQNLKSKFGLNPQVINGVTYKKSDIIRRKLMSNDFYVANFTLNYNRNQLNLTGGGSFSLFDGEHYGKLKWVKYNQNIPENYKWYNNDSNKKEFSVFIKGTYQASQKFSFFGDLQYRYIDYRMDGTDDDLEDITNNKYYGFFNPKAGISFNLNNHQLYASVAVGNREPLRTDIKESVKGGSLEKIKPERMYDYELGYRFANENASFNANLYYMDYKDQMTQTGKLNDVGYKLMENVPNSYRIGIELVGAYQFTKWLHWDANLTLSRNKIKDYTAYYDLYDNQTNWNLIGQKAENLGTTDISFSPNIVGSSVITLSPFKALSFSFISKYVGKQYYDNSSNKDNRLADYFISNIIAGYTFNYRKIGDIDLQLFVNNIFNKRYVANAWVSTDRFEDGSEITYKGYYPQATRNIMVKLGIRF
jgi:iron complex outermembrane receptor protein